MVGGGVIGAAVLYWLATLGVRNVVLLEKSSLGAGATGKSIGLVRRHYANSADTELAQSSWKFFRNWPDIVGGTCGWTETGFLVLAAPHDVSSLRANIQMQRRLGVDTAFVEPEELRDIDRSISIEGVGGAAYEPESGYADPATVVQGFVGRARQLGCSTWQGVTATALRTARDQIIAVDTSIGVVWTRTVVLATGAWSSHFLEALGIPLEIKVKRIIDVFTRRRDPTPHVAAIDLVAGTYFRPDGHDITIVGGRADGWGVDPDHYDPRASPAIIADAIQRAAKRMPALLDAGLLRGAAGVDGYSPDGHQVIGKAPGVEGLYLAVGGSGTGFKQSPAVGRGMAELITASVSRSIDLHPFRPERFSEGQPLQGPREYGVLPGVGSRMM